MNRPLFGCAHCDNRWGGSKTAHCGACHRTFSVLGAFDAHRQGRHADSARHCVDPAIVGLKRSTARGYELWTFPGRENEPEPESDVV